MLRTLYRIEDTATTVIPVINARPEPSMKRRNRNAGHWWLTQLFRRTH